MSKRHWSLLCEKWMEYYILQKCKINNRILNSVQNIRRKQNFEKKHNTV